MKPSTLFLLMAEFNTTHIPVVEVGKKYFGYEDRTAKNAAKNNKYPFPVFRLGNSKMSPWLVDISKLADYLDKESARAEREFKEAN